MSNNIRNYLKQNIWLSTWSLNLWMISRNLAMIQDSAVHRQLKHTHHAINKTMDAFDFYHPATQHNVIEKIDKQTVAST